jgi:hypothetical protein
MQMNTSRYRLPWVSALALLSLILTFMAVPPAYGQVDLLRFEFHGTFSDIGGNECLPPEQIGTVTGTVTVDAQEIATHSGSHFRSTDHLDYRVDFPNGSYALGSSVEHEEFNFIGRNSQIIDTLAIREPRTIYAADGQLIGRVMIHFLFHVVFRDTKGNDQPDPGEMTVSIEDFRFTCY